ncbi:hypothetical protein [Rhizobium miluonense]|uniref:hypothetical protein n=1 Tax=Rhizobium miluonense TaxID=411945 RepID=UPI0011125C64|nr:hypothetical protein [Rhizobium miluonense]
MFGTDTCVIPEIEVTGQSGSRFCLLARIVSAKADSVIEPSRLPADSVFPEQRGPRQRVFAAQRNIPIVIKHHCIKQTGSDALSLKSVVDIYSFAAEV